MQELEQSLGKDSHLYLCRAIAGYCKCQVGDIMLSQFLAIIVGVSYVIGSVMNENSTRELKVVLVQVEILKT